MRKIVMIAAAAAALCCAQVPAAPAGTMAKVPKMLTAKPLARGRSSPNALLNTPGDPGDDDTAISLDPTLSALCQSFIGQLNNYRIRARTSIRSTTTPSYRREPSWDATRPRTKPRSPSTREPAESGRGNQRLPCFQYPRKSRNDGVGVRIHHDSMAAARGRMCSFRT